MNDDLARWAFNRDIPAIILLSIHSLYTWDHVQRISRNAYAISYNLFLVHAVGFAGFKKVWSNMLLLVMGSCMVIYLWSHYCSLRDKDSELNELRGTLEGEVEELRRMIETLKKQLRFVMLHVVLDTVEYFHLYQGCTMMLL